MDGIQGLLQKKISLAEVPCHSNGATGFILYKPQKDLLFGLRCKHVCWQDVHGIECLANLIIAIYRARFDDFFCFFIRQQPKNRFNVRSPDHPLSIFSMPQLIHIVSIEKQTGVEVVLHHMGLGNG